MKVLCASVFRDGTGYAHAAIENALACEAAGLDVVCRSIRLSPMRGRQAAGRIGHLEAKDLRGVDSVIQTSLPHTFERKGGVRNIGFFAWETTHFRKSSWATYCNMMDEIWTFCLQSRQAILDSGVTVPIKIIPHACDVRRCEHRPAPLDIPMLKDKMVFYFIGEGTRRKNLPGLLRAYFAAFTSRDNVALVIKTHIPGMSAEQGSKHVGEMVADMKKVMRMHANPRLYPPVLVITRYLSEEVLDRLHATCHCFVMPSHGESWCIPAMDALSLGNPIIASNWGAFPDMTHTCANDIFTPATQEFDHVPINCGFLTPGHLVPCFAPDSSMGDLYTGDERWFDPDLGTLAQQMQDAHHVWQSRGGWLAYQEAAIARAKTFSHQQVGQIIRKALEG
jgi:glycosyltransferase involved in cell wall biosynthesis